MLTALFLYTDADKVDPLFYSYVKKKLDSKQEKITFEEFQKLFDISQSNFTRLSHEELTYVIFSLEISVMNNNRVVL